MNEPLTTSKPGLVFKGKAYNKHPQWYNEPLRLTEEQKREPLLILDDFFECYHLNEVRHTLWEWLTDVLSSQRSIAIDPLERNNHIYFYEKIERIIEAAYMMKKRIHKHRRKWEKRKLKQGNQPGKEQASGIKVGVDSHKLTTTTETAVVLFNKPKMLIEFVDENPMYVIIEVFKNESLPFLRDQLRDLLLGALSVDPAIYEEGEQRKQLLLFHEQLLLFVEALFVVYTQDREKAEARKHLSEIDKLKLLSQHQVANPMQVIAGFFEKFPMVYITRELNDWLEASICFDGTYPDNMSELQAFLFNSSCTKYQ